MITESFPIPGGSLQQAGTASRSLKQRLKQIGVAPAILRRIMIAAYEAEMNVVIHGWQGEMQVRLDDIRVDLEVSDRGPGIPDIEQALREGFSTAPPEARELGFGAGLGLPNIRRSSDRFEIFSEVGRGTRVCSTVFLGTQAAAGVARHSLEVRAERCRSCLACLKACPVQALRVRGGRPRVLGSRCVDCTACLAACPTGALAVAGLPERCPAPEAGPVDLVLPAAFLAGFGRLGGPAEVRAALAALGFPRVRLVEEWEEALGREVARLAEGEEAPRPLISPLCPAVVNLIELRFPGLIGSLAPYLSPVEAVRQAYGLREAVVAAACPAQRTVLEGGAFGSTLHAVHPAVLADAVLPLLGGRGAGAGDGAAAPEPGRWTAGEFHGRDPAGRLRAGGPRAVLSLLEQAEDGQLRDVRVLELTFCEGGCFGSPLLREEAAVARYRWRSAAGDGFETAAPGGEARRGGAPFAGGLPFGAPEPRAAAVRRTKPPAARAGLRLDEDMAVAIARLGRIDRLAGSLPGRDCGVCGAPTCAALAEDVVLGRAMEGGSNPAGSLSPAAATESNPAGSLSPAAATDCPFWTATPGGES